MIISHEHRFIFMKTLKAAGTSVEIELSRICGPDDVITPLPAEDEIVRAEHGGRPPQNYEAPPLRERVHEHIRASRVRPIVGRPTWEAYFTFAVDRNPWDAVVSAYFWSKRNGNRSTFPQFVASPTTERLALRNYQAYHVGGEVAVDRVLLFEHLAEELAEVWQHLSLPGAPALPRAKVGTRPATTHYRDLYDAESAETVRRLFARQIDELGYTY